MEKNNRIYNFQKREEERNGLKSKEMQSLRKEKMHVRNQVFGSKADWGFAEKPLAVWRVK